MSKTRRVSTAHLISHLCILICLLAAYFPNSNLLGLVVVVIKYVLAAFYLVQRGVLKGVDGIES